MNFLKAFAVTSAAMLSAPSAMALTVDLFDDAVAQTVVDDAGVFPVPQGSEVLNPNVLGGARDLWVETQPGGTVLGTTMNVQNGVLTFNNSSGQMGYGEIVYDGVDGDPTVGGDADVNKTGLNHFDLTSGQPGQGFFFEVLIADGVFDFTATIWDMLGNFHTYSESIVNLAFDPFLPLTDFSSNGVDVTNVGAIAFTVQSTSTVSIDGTLGSITVIPLPASALLLLGGLGGLFGVSAVGRRRRHLA